MWVRGLKLAHYGIKPKHDDVAPHVGAWIETVSMDGNGELKMSHPMWVRGLKH